MRILSVLYMSYVIFPGPTGKLCWEAFGTPRQHNQETAGGHWRQDFSSG